MKLCNYPYKPVLKLRKEYKSQYSYPELINYLLDIKYQLCSLYELLGEWDNAIEKINKGILLTEKSKYKQQQGRFKFLLGNMIFKKGKYDEAMSLYESVKNIAKENDNLRLYSKAVGGIGTLYFLKGQFDKALNNYNKAMQIYNKLGDDEGYKKMISNIGTIYYRKGDFDKAMKYYDEAKKYSYKLDAISSLEENIGNLYLEKGDYDKAMKYYKKSITSKKKLGDKRGYARTVGNLGNVYVKKKDQDNALKCYQELKQISKELGDKRGYAIAIGNIGNIHLERGESEKALKNYHIQRDVFKKIGNKFEYATVTGNISFFYSKKQDYDNAIEYGKEANNLFKDLGIKRLYSLMSAFIGEYYNKKGKYETAIDYFKESIITQKETKQIFYNTYVYLAVCISKIKKPNDSLKKITSITELEETPEVYFDFALTGLEKDKKYEDFILSLYKYGQYLYQVGKKEEGLNKINLAKEIAKKRNKTDLLKKLFL